MHMKVTVLLLTGVFTLVSQEYGNFHEIGTRLNSSHAT